MLNNRTKNALYAEILSMASSIYDEENEELAMDLDSAASDVERKQIRDAHKPYLAAYRRMTSNSAALLLRGGFACRTDKDTPENSSVIALTVNGEEYPVPLQNVRSILADKAERILSDAAGKPNADNAVDVGLAGRMRLDDYKDRDVLTYLFFAEGTKTTAAVERAEDTGKGADVTREKDPVEQKPQKADPDTGKRTAEESREAAVSEKAAPAEEKRDTGKPADGKAKGPNTGKDAGRADPVRKTEEGKREKPARDNGAAGNRKQESRKPRQEKGRSEPERAKSVQNKPDRMPSFSDGVEYGFDDENEEAATTTKRSTPTVQQGKRPVPVKEKAESMENRTAGQETEKKERLEPNSAGDREKGGFGDLLNALKRTEVRRAPETEEAECREQSVNVTDLVMDIYRIDFADKEDKARTESFTVMIAPLRVSTDERNFMVPTFAYAKSNGQTVSCSSPNRMRGSYQIILNGEVFVVRGSYGESGFDTIMYPQNLKDREISIRRSKKRVSEDARRAGALGHAIEKAGEDILIHIMPLSSKNGENGKVSCVACLEDRAEQKYVGFCAAGKPFAEVTYKEVTYRVSAYWDGMKLITDVSVL